MATAFRAGITIVAKHSFYSALFCIVKIQPQPWEGWGKVKGLNVIHSEIPCREHIQAEN